MAAVRGFVCSVPRGDVVPRRLPLTACRKPNQASLTAQCPYRLPPKTLSERVAVRSMHEHPRLGLLHLLKRLAPFAVIRHLLLGVLDARELRRRTLARGTARQRDTRVGATQPDMRRSSVRCRIMTYRVTSDGTHRIPQI